ncbi:MAG: tRNA (adenosine(37)-N6)-dimethylallyltransferase MiaA [Kiritimatiellales bacterium]|nr:tRNA (adenosine(37)-N6)-dimethylallyltransferase MiaA [Kiritimatiellota bacterium]MBL7011936.1 tRNA (adenosine(37)-N6)-dimethylallyltransferase MiaA [Kiritimatiellales bacterium]
MTTNSPSAFVLVGPTASGKSSIAQLLAEQTGAPVVSADSMNIYRGMDIGTAKPSPAERGAVEYHGIDLADPTEPFSVGDWLNAVKPALDGQTSIVAGGTGLYVKCLLAGLDELPAADEALRARAEKMSLAELQAEARAAAPEAYDSLADNENPRRLVRLLEHGGLPQKEKVELPTVVGLHVERDVLHKRIATRVDKMYANGLIEEARGLSGLQLSVTAEKAIGYAEAFAVLRGGMTEAQAKERTIIRTRQLAKRQMTWFRTQLNVEWVDTAKFSSSAKATADRPNLEKIAAEVSNVWKPVRIAV